MTMIDTTTKIIFGIAIVTTSVLGVLVHKAMSVEVTPTPVSSNTPTVFTCSIVEDITFQGNVKSCCWDGQCARFPVMPY